MNDTYRWVLEAENESLREQVKELKKKIKQTIDKAVIWVDENVGTTSAIAIRKTLED